MKKLFYVLPILGLLCFVSCDTDESDEIVDETNTIDQSQIEIIENTSSKAFPRLNAFILYGLYGSNDVDAFETVTYTYIPPTQFWDIPKEYIKYKIEFYVDDPDIGWTFMHEEEVPSNYTSLSFPVHKNLSFAQWQITYKIIGLGSYGNLSGSSNKIVIVRN